MVDGAPSSPPEGPAPTSRAQALALAALVAALALGVFAPAVSHEWLNYDDDVYITGNPALLRGLSAEGVAWAFSTFYGANWFPVTWLSWLADYELFGLDPAGFHATSVVIHALASAVLCLALSGLTGSPGRSGFVAAVFAVHPLQVEPVAWAAGRKDPLAGLFFALALLVYASAARRASRGWRLILLACLALGLMSKPTLITLPCVLLLLDAWPLSRLRSPGDPGRWDAARVRAALREKLPLFAAAALFGAVVVAAQGGGGMLVPLERLPLAARIENALVSYAVYLGKAFWPTDLAPIYPHAAGSLPAWQPLGAALLLAAATAGALLAGRRRPYLAVGWLWYLLMLAPAIGLVQVGSQARADRYAYLPLVGLSLAVTWGASELLGRRARAGLAAAAVAALAVGASAQLRHWRDSEALFRQTLRVTRENAIAHAHLGAALLERGGAQEAIEHYREALRIRPAYVDVANNLAWLLATAEEPSLRDPPEAVRLAEHAAGLTGRADAGVLDTLAAGYAAAGRFVDARRTLGEAIALARRNGQQDLELLLRTRVALYREERPYREPVAADGSRRVNPR